MKLDVILNTDCLGPDGMPSLPDKSVDLVLTDPPYGTTACEWDSIIPLEPMWDQLKRIIKPNGVIVMTASQPFTTTLVSSNMKMFKYCWVWNKKKPGNIFLAKSQPMKVHEDILIFGYEKPNYYPILVVRDKIKTSKNYGTGKAFGGNGLKENKRNIYIYKYPKSIIEASNANQQWKIHPTQKPVALMEYLIKTYTNEGETVLDFASGSGTTAIASWKTQRHFICMEKDEQYWKDSVKRLKPYIEQRRLDDTGRWF